jgi:flagellar hook-associated protein 1
MSNLLALIGQSATAMDAYEEEFQVIQNNVANANTPGFAQQNLSLVADPFDPPTLSGGVSVGTLQSTQDNYAEQSLRNQNSGLGLQQQLSTSLASISSVFDISGNSGIDYALNNFYTAVSTWTQDPSSAVDQQQVIDQAGNVAQAFQQASTQLQQIAQQTQSQTQDTVQQVNQLVGQIQAYNQQIESDGAGANNAGLQANVNAALDSLSSLVNITATQQPDGTTTIMLNGSTPLLVGTQQYPLSYNLVSQSSPPASYENAPPESQILAADGTDVTSQTTGGQLGALLQISNSVLPSIQGGANQVGSLNTLAQSFADTVNSIFTSGTNSTGQSGIPLFTYSDTNSDGTTNPTQVASTLAVNSAATAGQLATSTPGPPEVSNGVPLALASLEDPTNSAYEIDGDSFTQYYGNIATSVGDQAQQAKDGVQVQQSLVSQAQNQIQQISGVSIDGQAMLAVEFQNAYQASAQLFTVLDQLTQDTINMLASTQ